MASEVHEQEVAEVRRTTDQGRQYMQVRDQREGSQVLVVPQGGEGSAPQRLQASGLPAVGSGEGVHNAERMDVP